MPKSHPMGHDGMVDDFETVEGEEAIAVADTPFLTGDPEWDAVELAETHPTQELRVQHA